MEDGRLNKQLARLMVVHNWKRSHFSLVPAILGRLYELTDLYLCSYRDGSDTDDVDRYKYMHV